MFKYERNGSGLLVHTASGCIVSPIVLGDSYAAIACTSSYAAREIMLTINATTEHTATLNRYDNTIVNIDRAEPSGYSLPATRSTY